MKKFKFVLFAIVFLFVFFSLKNSVLAADSCQLVTDPNTLYKNTRSAAFKVYSSDLDQSKKYQLKFNCSLKQFRVENLVPNTDDQGTYVYYLLSRPDGGCEFDSGDHTITLFDTKDVCPNVAYQILNSDSPAGTNPNTTQIHVDASGGKPPIMCSDGVQTAVGCIQTNDSTTFVLWLLKLAIGIGGGIAFILMIVGVLQIITSAGNPDRLKAGQELITNALIGLLMIIFSLFLLRLIGINILQIPGLSSPGFSSI